MSLDTILGRRPDESLEAAANRVVDELLAARASRDTMRAVTLGAERKADALAADCNAAQEKMAADCQAALDKAAAVVAALRAELDRRHQESQDVWSILAHALLGIGVEASVGSVRCAEQAAAAIRPGISRGDLINARARAGASRVEAEDAFLRTRAGSPERVAATRRLLAAHEAEEAARAAEVGPREPSAMERLLAEAEQS